MTAIWGYERTMRMRVISLFLAAVLMLTLMPTATAVAGDENETQPTAPSETVTQEESAQQDTAEIEPPSEAARVEVAEQPAVTSGIFFEEPAEDDWPDITSISITGGGVSLRWSAYDTAQMYRVFYDKGLGWQRLGDTGSTGIVYPGAAAGKNYKYTVRAMDDTGAYISSYNKDGWSYKFLKAPVVSVSNIEGGQYLSWNKVSGAVYYKLYEKRDAGAWQEILKLRGTSCTRTKLRENSRYQYAVRCVSADGNTLLSYFCGSRTIKYLSPPNILTFKNSKQGATLSWSAVRGAAKYRVFVKKNGQWTSIGTTEKREFTHKKIKSGTTYTYTVRAYNASGEPVTGYNSSGRANTYAWYAGKRILSFGDSIMYGYGNHGKGISVIEGQKLGMKVADYSVNGASFEKISGHRQIIDQINKAIRKREKADVILIDGGTNDLICGKLGKMMSGRNYKSANQRTFSGSLEYALGTLKAAYPKTPIIYIRAHNMVSTDDRMEKKFGETALKIAEKWGVKTVDIYPLLNTENAALRNAYTYYRTERKKHDSIHPTAAGYLRYYIPSVTEAMVSVMK